MAGISKDFFKKLVSVENPDERVSYNKDRAKPPEKPTNRAMERDQQIFESKNRSYGFDTAPPPTPELPPKVDINKNLRDSLKLGLSIETERRGEKQLYEKAEPAPSTVKRNRVAVEPQDGINPNFRDPLVNEGAKLAKELGLILVEDEAGVILRDETYTPFVSIFYPDRSSISVRFFYESGSALQHKTYTTAFVDYNQMLGHLDEVCQSAIKHLLDEEA